MSLTISKNATEIPKAATGGVPDPSTGGMPKRHALPDPAFVDLRDGGRHDMTAMIEGAVAARRGMVGLSSRPDGTGHKSVSSREMNEGVLPRRERTAGDSGNGPGRPGSVGGGTVAGKMVGREGKAGNGAFLRRGPVPDWTGR